MMTPKKRLGRPPAVFDEEIAGYILERIATSSDSLRTICEDDGVTISVSTVLKWLQQNSTFASQYARAKDAQADAIAEDMLDIADNPRMQKITTEIEGETATLSITTKDAIERSKLMIESRKWLLGKLKPKKYGDKIEMEHTGGVILQHSISRPVREEKK